MPCRSTDQSARWQQSSPHHAATYVTSLYMQRMQAMMQARGFEPISVAAKKCIRHPRLQLELHLQPFSGQRSTVSTAYRLSSLPSCSPKHDVKLLATMVHSSRIVFKPINCQGERPNNRAAHLHTPCKQAVVVSTLQHVNAAHCKSTSKGRWDSCSSSTTTPPTWLSCIEC